MAYEPKPHQGLPTKDQILEFIKTARGPTGKKEIGKFFGVKGQDKIALKALLKDMAEQGMIDGKRTSYHSKGGLSKVSVLRVVDVEDGEPIAIPETWQPDDATPPPRIRVIESKKHGALRNNDRILARTEERGGGWIAHPIKKLPVADQAMMGVIEFDGAGKPWLAPVDKKIRNSSHVVDLGGAEEGNLVLAETVGRSNRAGVKVIEVLGDPLAPKAFSLIAIHKHGIPNHFTQEVLDEANESAELPLSEDDREDLRHLPIVAIDPADARDHDDAIWAAPNPAGGFDAVIAIADVSYYVRPGGDLDQEARKRGNSVYFPDRVVPMLPEILSTQVCSLGEGEARAAMACHIKISAKGEVTDWRFSRAIVKIASVMAYEDAQASIDDGSAADNLKNLWSAWKALASARANRDPLNLELPERRVMLNDEGKITEIAVKERIDAHRVVEDFMIAANVAAAKALEGKNMPVVYRVHETPSREKLMSLKEYFDSIGKNLALGQVITPSLFNRMIKDVADPAEQALVMQAVLRSQTQAYYGPQNMGHFGLALGSYAHFTSPIRRYADLLVHRALVDGFGLEQPKPKGDLPAKSGLSDKDRSDLATISDAISVTERRAMEAERDTVDRYVAAWLSARVGETFETRITGVQKFGFFATIVDLGGDGLVPVSTLGRDYFNYDESARALVGEKTGQTYAVGDLLELRLGEANPLTGAMKFEPLDAEGNSIKPRGNREKHKKRNSSHRKGSKNGPRGKSGGGKSGGGKNGRGKSGGSNSGGNDSKGGHSTGQRGRPGNIRHQGRNK